LLVAKSSAPESVTSSAAFDLLGLTPSLPTIEPEAAAIIFARHFGGPAPPLLNDLFHLSCLLTT
jgi:hypothetical protein